MNIFTKNSLIIISVITSILPSTQTFAQSTREISIEAELDKVEIMLDEHETNMEKTFGDKETRHQFVKHINHKRSKSISELLDSNEIQGELKIGVGVEGNDFYWNKANFDLNESNFRELSDHQLNNKENTYDPAIFDRVKIELNSTINPKLSVHTNITIDPWSYTAKSDELIVNGNGGDRLALQYLYWGNSGYAINQSLTTLDNGDGIALPELKPTGGRILPTTLSSTFGNTFNVPEAKLESTFNPFREFWLNYSPNEKLKIKLFPLAYEDAAYTSDDPLKISNNKTWWEESPWLSNWQKGNLNTGPVPDDFTKGEWNDDLAFFTRDSDGQRLTALRGAALDYQLDNKTSIHFTAATPKTLWQNYGEVFAVPASARIKYKVNDKLFLGNTNTAHIGLHDNDQDAYNYVSSFDLGFQPYDHIKFESQFSASISKQDILNETYVTEKDGHAYYFAMTTSSDEQELLSKDYYSIHPQNSKINFFKNKLSWARMDKNFEASLSNYSETRDDAFWSRHINFYPSLYNQMPGAKPALSTDDLTPFAIGDSLDYGRYVFAWRSEMSLLNGSLNGLIDVRNAHKTDNNKHIETVARSEWSHKTTDKLTTKLFLLSHTLPDTKGGFDSFIFDVETDDFLANTAIPDGEDPSLNTQSLGFNYDVNKWLSLNSVWEHTNDFTAATDNFPRGIYNSSSFATYSEGSDIYRKAYPFLYSQQYFDQAPYSYHNIFKVGFGIRPSKKLNFYLDYTRNPHEYAGSIDDNMNHVGLEMSYIPNERSGLFLRYTWSRLTDIYRLVNDGVSDFESHHNVFTELRYKFQPEDKLSFQFGIGPSDTIASSASNPYGTSYPTLDTQKIFRLFYEREF